MVGVLKESPSTICFQCHGVFLKMFIMNPFMDFRMFNAPDSWGKQFVYCG